MNDKEDREVGNGVVYVVASMVIITIIVLATIVILSISSGTFCPTASMVLCGLALFAATSKGVR